jgi:hypothetical protein
MYTNERWEVNSTGTKGIIAELKTITKEEANRVLNKNEHSRNTRKFVNRPINKRIVAKYADQMRRGQWTWDNGDSIKFSSDGFLLDGQHRLRAMVDSNIKEIKTLVICNIDTKAFPTLDAGVKRRLSHIIATKHPELDRGLKGGNKSALVATCVKGYISMKNSPTYNSHRYGEDLKDQKNIVSDGDLENEYESSIELYNDVIEHSKQFNANKKGSKYVTIFTPTEISMFNILLVKDYKWDNELVQLFFRKLCDNGEIDPLLLKTRTYFIRNLHVKESKERQQRYSLLVKTWNSFVTNRKPLLEKVMKFTEESEFPKFLTNEKSV